jgi:tetratricopeptide (TPR) repeat protein
MSKAQPLDQTDIQTKIKEAEACHSMGMNHEALSLYEQVLSLSSDQDDKSSEAVRNKISHLRKEIEVQEMAENQGLSAEDITLFRKNLSLHDDVPTILDGARALKELGLIEEASAEFEKSDYSKLDYSPGQIVVDYLTCLLKTHKGEDVVKKANKAIYKHNLNDKENAQIQFWLGNEMEKRDQRDQALELFETAAKIDPKNEEITNKINSLQSNLSTSSRYDFLLQNKSVTTKNREKCRVRSG